MGQPSDTDPTGRRAPQWTLGSILLVVVMVAANLSLAARLTRGFGSGAWQIVLLFLGANAFFCALLGVVVRFRIVAMLTMFTVAALTEAMLIEVVTARRNTDWIIAVAVLGGFMLLAIEVAHRADRRTRRR